MIDPAWHRDWTRGPTGTGCWMWERIYAARWTLTVAPQQERWGRPTAWRWSVQRVATAFYDGGVCRSRLAAQRAAWRCAFDAEHPDLGPLVRLLECA